MVANELQPSDTYISLRIGVEGGGKEHWLGQVKEETRVWVRLYKVPMKRPYRPVQVEDTDLKLWS